MTPYDTLLTYLSELQQGSWTQFKRACQTLWDQDDTHRDQAALVARAFSVLGHLEVAWDASPAWAITAPALVLLPRRANPIAMLCGYRPPSLLDDLHTLEGPFDIQVTAQAEGPGRIQVHAKSRSQLRELGQKLNIAFAEHVVERLVLSLPTLPDLLVRAEMRPLPSVPPAERFDPVRITWVPANDYTGDGLYRLEHYVPDYRLIQGPGCRKVEREVGVYAAIRASRWGYDGDTHTLAIPSGLLPPPLYQRALVLCSGQLASYDRQRRSWQYPQIPPAIAQALATKLGQSLEDVCR